jgi:plasmid replication initiation protein
MSISEKKLVVQHNRIVEARYRLSVGEQRIIKLLISMIERDDEDFKAYQIPIKQFSDLLEIPRNDFYRQVKAITKKLISNVLVFRENIDDDDELQVAWLTSAEYIKTKGIVEVEFSPKLKPFLLQLKREFVKYELGNVIHLKRTYSIRIYELLKQHQKFGNRKFDIQTLSVTACNRKQSGSQSTQFSAHINCD